MCHAELNSTLTKKPSDISIASHEAGCCVRGAKEEVVSRDLVQRESCGLGRAEMQRSGSLWGCGGGKKSRHSL